MTAIILDARRKEYIFELFRYSAEGYPESVAPARIAEPVVVARELAGDPALTSEKNFLVDGSGLDSYGTVFEEYLGDRFIPVPEPTQNPDPIIIGQLGLHKFRQQGGIIQNICNHFICVAQMR